MSRVFVCGLGAVSPAGWTVAAMREALDQGAPLPIQPLERPGWTKPLLSRLVPNPAQRLAFLGHPRLRRTSPVTHYAAAAALEAVAKVRPGNDPFHSLGIIVCLQSGCVNYSYRFFDETLKDPATASPLLFPETVFAAPASHVASLLGNAPLVYTLLGDPASFLQGLALGAEWLEEKRVAACLVIGAEETNWLRADALWHLDHRAIISGGAGAVCLSLDPALSVGVELERITAIHTYTAIQSRSQAARAMRAELPAGSPEQLLCDGIGDSPRTDAPEIAAWRDWSGPRFSPKRILGEGLMAAGAWQSVASCDAVAGGRFAAAIASLVGCNQHAIGTRFVRGARGISHLPAASPTGSIAP
jgi:3-oxoacyl-(acyl-carrier-protein) synthase